MINNMINGFCMAIADSVPGVSGGTIAYIMGFYQKLVDSVHDLFGKDREKRNVAARYLIKLGIGWALGFLSAMLVLAAMFAKHIFHELSVPGTQHRGAAVHNPFRAKSNSRKISQYRVYVPGLCDRCRTHTA